MRANVLGIGVAVITRMWGETELFSAKAARCLTPNRCCSSVITSAKSEKATSSEKRAWVPTAIFISPLLSFSMVSLLSFAFVLPVRRQIGTPGSMAFNESKCWRARISVGAIMAHWCPFLYVRYKAAAPTAVLPLPTSP